MLCLGLVEQAYREHMPDEYKLELYYYRVAVDHILSLQDTHESTTVVHNRTKELRNEPKGARQAEEHWLSKYMSYNETTKTIMPPYWLQKFSNLSALWNLIRSAPR